MIQSMQDPPYMSPTKQWASRTADIRDKKAAEQGSPVVTNDPVPWLPSTKSRLIEEPTHSQVWGPDGRERPESTSATGMGNEKAPFGRSLNSRGVPGQHDRYAAKESVASIVFSHEDATGVHANQHTGDFWQNDQRAAANSCGEEVVMQSDYGVCSGSGRRHYVGLPYSNYKETAGATDLLKAGSEGMGSEADAVQAHLDSNKYVNMSEGKMYRNIYTNSERPDCTGPHNLMGAAAIRKVPYDEKRKLRGPGWDGPAESPTASRGPTATTTTAGTTRWGL